MAIIVSETTPKIVASENGHWYDGKTGEPRYTVIGANGKERPTTLRDARKYGYVPSVTTIIRQAASPGLDAWKQQQVLLAALTLPRHADETDDAFVARVIADSRETGRKAADRGTALHSAIERWIVSGGREFQGAWQPHVDATYAALKEVGIDVLAGGRAEPSFAHPRGYGGKIDYASDECIVDFKSKATVDKAEAYDEHVMQLRAYDIGLGYHGRRLINVFVGCDDVKVKLHEWSAKDGSRGLAMFFSLLEYWWAKVGFFKIGGPD